MQGRIGFAVHRFVRVAVAFAVLAALAAALAPDARAAGGATVTVHLQGCPDGFDGAHATRDDFFNTCTSPIGGSVVQLVYGAVAPAGQTDLDGYYSLGGVTPGDVTVYQFPPDPSWTMRAFCTTYTGSSGPGDYAEVYLVNGSVTYTLADGEYLVCQWYNYAPIVAPPTTVTVHAIGCPTGFDGRSASIYDFAYYCQTPLGGFDFALQYNGLAPAHQTDLDGSWTFDGIPAGYVAVGEYPPDQNLLTRAFCNVYDVNTGNHTGYQEAQLAQGAAAYNLPAYKALDCEWYNFYAVQTTTANAMIRLRSCPDGYDLANASIYDLAADCQGQPDTFGFSLTPVNSAALAGQPGDLNSFTWSGIPSGKLTIQQSPSDGSASRAFCNQRSLTSGEVGNYEVPVAPDGTATDWLFAGYDGYDCDWYVSASATQGSGSATPVVVGPGNGAGQGTPVSGGSGNGSNGNNGNGGNGTTGNGGIAPTSITSLTITAFACPDGYDVLAPDADPAKDCTDAAAGITFTSLGERSGKLATRTTDLNGSLTFGKLNSGDHLITGEFAGGTSFIGTCTSNRQSFSGPLTPLAFVGPNGAIWIDVEKGEQLSCTWYNIPA